MTSPSLNNAADNNFHSFSMNKRSFMFSTRFFFCIEFCNGQIRVVPICSRIILFEEKNCVRGCRQSMPPPNGPPVAPLMAALLSRLFRFADANERMSLSNAQTMKIRMFESNIHISMYGNCKDIVT